MSGVGARSAYLSWLAQALHRPDASPDPSVEGDVVLGYATGYDAADIAPFVRSLRRVFAGPVALVVDDRANVRALLAEEGGDARNLARLAARIARANAALEVLVDGAERYLALKSEDNPDAGFDAALFAVMPDEIRLRLLKRAIDRAGHEGPAELGKVEALLAAVDQALDGALGPRESKIGRAHV